LDLLKTINTGGSRSLKYPRSLLGNVEEWFNGELYISLQNISKEFWQGQQDVIEEW